MPEFEFNPAEFSDINKEHFPEYYDLEDVFDRQIDPLLKSIVNICNEYGLPLAVGIQYKNNETEAMICSAVVLPVTRTDERLVNVAKILFD